MPQMPAVWNRNMITLNNGSGTRDNYQVAQSSSNYQYSRYAIRNPPYQHQQNLAPYPWIPPSRPPLLSPPVPPCYNEQKVGSQNFGKPLDKTITDTIDQVKRKLKERKLSESQKEKINSSTESSFEEHSNNKAIEKKRIEHVKMSPKISVTKKFSKKDDLKNVSNMTTEKSNQQQKSQTLRKNILKQLFKLDKNNLQEILSNPESSNKYSCALSSLIKDTRISISKELRNVAEKSLQFHNISANSEQGEKIVQNAFLGHLETLLDNSSSLELFNMEPQLINELSKVLRQDLMGSMNEICLENLRDVMHESIMEEAKDQKYPLELTNVDNLNFDFTDESNFIKKEIDENSCNDFSLCIKNENYDSDCEDQIISTNPLNHGEGPQPVDQGSEEFEKRLQSIKIENNKIETVKFSPLTSSDSGCSQNFKENTSPGKSDETFREQILRNFDIATNKYETGTNSSNKPKKRKHNETNSLNDKWKQSTSKSDYFNDNNTFSYAPENSSRTETKINISAVPQIESTNLKSRNTNSYSKVETLNPIDSNTHAFPKDIVIPQNKNLHNFTHLNSAQNSNSFSNKIANAETISNNTHETKKKDESSLKFSEDCKRDNESHSSNHLQNNSTYQNKVSITTALQNIENANYNKNIQTDRKLPKNPLDIHTSEKYNNHKTDKRNLKFKRSRFDKSNSIIDDNKTKKVTDSSQMNLTNAELKGKGKIVTDKRMKTIKSSQIENQIDKMCTDTNDLSSVVNKIVENNHSKNISFPKNNMKNQGTQYIDFKKTNVSTQIYASLISSKSKGCQACKINMKDIHCQTSVHISEQDVNKMKEYKEMVNKACQTDLFTELDKTNNPKNLVSREVETSDIPTDKNFLSKEKNQNDALSKMKLIDNEIHQLLQNRYELYKSLQSTSFLTDGNGDRFNFKLRHIPNLSDYNKSNLDSQIKKYNTQVKNSLSHSIEKASAVDNNSISNRVICNKSKSQKSKKQSSVHSTKHKSTEKSKKSCSGSSLPINNDALSKMHKSDKIKESKDNFSTINNKEVTSESTDKNKVLSVDNNCNSSYLELRNNTPCNKLKNESLNCLDHQNTPIINKKISPKESFHNKIVCKRKPKSINKNFKDSKDRMKKTPLSILISELNDSDDEIDDLDVKNVPKENENRLNINIPKENPILNLRKKYNIKNCSVKLEPVNIQKRYLKENINSHSDNDLIHEKISPNLSNRNFSISLDEIDDVFENLTDPDIPSMLENIRGNETMALVDNWDSQLFENVTLSESVNVFADEGNSPEITTVTSNPTDVCLSKNEDTLQVSDESKSFTDNSESSENTISLNDHTDSIIAIEVKII